jgi:hypothetical protein
VLEDSGSYLYFSVRYLILGSDLGCLSLFVYFEHVVEIFTLMLGLEDFMYWCLWSLTCIFGDVYPLRSCLNLYACYVGRTFVDAIRVFIALIEIGCYNDHKNLTLT